jgi:tight adherence protein B
VGDDVTTVVALTTAGLVLASAAALAGAARATRSARVRGRLADGAAAGPDGPRPRTPGGAPRWLCRRLVAAGISWDPAVVWRVALVAGPGAVAAAGLFAGVGLAAVAAAAVVAGPVVVLTVLDGRGDRLVEAALPDALEAVGRSLRSGASLRQGLTEAAHACAPVLGAELRALDGAVGLGVPLVDALEAWGARRSLPGVRLAVAALALGAETGGAQARAVDGVAATVRGRLALEAEVRALSSQARASALVLVVAPLVFCAAAVATDPGTAEFLLRTPLGLGCVAAGLTLDGVAGVWMARITRVDR